MDGTRPNPNNAKHAVVAVTNLESGEEFKIVTEHAVLNVPTEVSSCAPLIFVPWQQLWTVDREVCEGKSIAGH